MICKDTVMIRNCKSVMIRFDTFKFDYDTNSVILLSCCGFVALLLTVQDYRSWRLSFADCQFGALNYQYSTKVDAM